MMPCDLLCVGRGGAWTVLPVNNIRACCPHSIHASLNGEFSTLYVVPEYYAVGMEIITEIGKRMEVATCRKSLCASTLTPLTHFRRYFE